MIIRPDKLLIVNPAQSHATLWEMPAINIHELEESIKKGDDSPLLIKKHTSHFRENLGRFDPIILETGEVVQPFFGGSNE